MDRAPSGWVRCRCGFESSPFRSSARRPSVRVYVPASRIDRENAKVNILKFSPGEVANAVCSFICGWRTNEDRHCDKPVHAVPLASACQHLENRKENQAGHSPERAVEAWWCFPPSYSSKKEEEEEEDHRPRHSHATPRHAREGGSGSAAFLSARRVFCCVVLAFGLVHPRT